MDVLHLQGPLLGAAVGEEISLQLVADVHMSIDVYDAELLVQSVIDAALYGDGGGMVAADHGELLPLADQRLDICFDLREDLVTVPLEVSGIQHRKVFVVGKTLGAWGGVVGVSSQQIRSFCCAAAVADAPVKGDAEDHRIHIGFRCFRLVQAEPGHGIQSVFILFVHG